MKRMFISIGLLLLTGYVFGQAFDGTVDYQTVQARQPAVLIYLPYSPDVIKAALQRYLAEAGKPTKKGARNYQLSGHTALALTNVNDADMYFEIGRKDALDNNESVVYLLLKSSYESILSHTAVAYYFDPAQAKAYLNNLAVAIGPYATGLQVKLQKKDLANAETYSNRLLRKGITLNEKAKSLDQKAIGMRANAFNKQKATNARKIVTNSQEQIVQTAEVEKQKAALALLINQRKP